MSYLVMNKFLEDMMSDDGKHEAREKHPKCDNRRACKRISKATVNVSTLEPNKCRKNNDRRREDIANCDAVDKYLLRQPATEDHGLCLDERDCSVCATERKASSDETKDEKVCEIGSPCNAEG